MRVRLHRGILRPGRIARLALFTTLGCGVLALGAPVASAFSAAISFNGCTSVTFTYQDFSAGAPIVASETLSISGTQVASQPFAFTPSAPNLTETDSIPIADRTNGDTLVASVTYSVPTQGVIDTVVTSPPYTLAGCPTPTIVTKASPSVPVGGTIFDAAALSGGASPTGTITFDLYAAGDTTCSNVLATSTTAVNGDGVYASPGITAPAGVYQWTVRYGGDPNNAAAAEGCGQAPEQVIVFGQFRPTIATTASPGPPKGCVFPVGKTRPCNVSDSAALGGGVTPTGTITFNLYAASDAACSKVLATDTVPVSGDGSYSSKVVAETTPQGYQWSAVYSGDANNTPAYEGCGSEKVALTRPAAACVAVTASLNGPFGLTISRSFVARLKVVGAASVTFYLDGHKLGTVTKAQRDAFSFAIDTPSLSIGMHTVLARVKLKQKGCKPVARSASFVHGIGVGS